MVVRELIREISAGLCDVENHLFDVHLMLRSVLGLSPIDLVLSCAMEVSPADEAKIRAMAARRKTGEPLCYILGSAEFMGLEFYVDKNVLIPRADTETLVETALSALGKKGALLLDIGCGSGCIGLSIAHFNSRVFLRGVDISPEAVKISEKNARSLALSDRAAFEVCDILTRVPGGKYDVIVSNPPYIRSGEIPQLMRDVRDFEPYGALSGGEDGLVFYRRICEIAPALLNPGGILAFEIGYDQADEVGALLRRDFADIKTVRDLGGNDRVVCGVLQY